MNDKVIDNRIPVDVEVKPVKIKEDDFGLLGEISEGANELERVRAEMGRLYQILSNVKDRADAAEKNLTEKRKALSDKYELGVDGQWVIDFESKEFVKVAKKVPNLV